ncbi:hypothetical protein ACHAWU_003758 [Discostella pseudostelligera]|uniref:Methyltransferase FkbM domain-containing protein n=1 Tax=Discostella pseudostelligera TaxID=259834 RepID=A0ABD3N6D3_9STRA
MAGDSNANATDPTEGGSIDNDGSTSWKVIDWKHPFSVDEESSFTCTWTHFRSYLSGESAPIPLNGVNNNDHNHDDDQSVVYVEIGANIGSCVMEMLLSTNASIVAFEPHPRNLYNLKKTVSLLDETYQNRLALFPVGPGNASMTSTIYSGSDNLVIGHIIRDYPNQAFEERNQFTVNVERLDSILVANKMK